MTPNKQWLFLLLLMLLPATNAIIDFENFPEIHNNVIGEYHTCVNVACANYSNVISGRYVNISFHSTSSDIPNASLDISANETGKGKSIVYHSPEGTSGKGKSVSIIFEFKQPLVNLSLGEYGFYANISGAWVTFELFYGSSTNQCLQRWWYNQNNGIGTNCVTGPNASTLKASLMIHNFTVNRTIANITYAVLSFGTTTAVNNTVKFDNFNFPIEFENTVIDIEEENQLPVINEFSYNNSVCYNSSFTTNNVPLKLNVTDPESDTIYYSIYGLKSLLEYEVNYEDFLDNSGYPDLGFFTRGNYQSNRSYPTTLNENSYHVATGFADIDHTIGQIVGQSILVTSLENNKPWYYSSSHPLYNTSSVTFNLMFPSYNTGLDYMLYDSLNNKLLNVSIHINESYWLTIYYDGVLNQSIQFGRFSPSNTSNELYLVNTWTTGSIITYIQDGGNRINVLLRKNITSASLQKVGFFPHSRSYEFGEDFQPAYFLSELEINGYNYVPKVDWTTDKPINYSMTSSSSVLKLYVSDSIHMLDTYNTQSLYITVPDCQYHADIGYTIDDNPFVFFPDTIKTPLNNYIVSLGLEDTAAKFLWILWFIIFVMIMGTELLITKSLNFGYPFIGATVGCLVCSILVGYPLHILTYLILLAFAMARPFMDYVGGG